MASNDDFLRRMMQEDGIPEHLIDEAIESRNDLLTADEVRAKLVPGGYEDDDIRAAIAAIADRGPTLSKHNGQQLFTFSDYEAITTELIERKLRRLAQSEHLQGVRAGFVRLCDTQHSNAPEAAQVAARDELEEAIRAALHNGDRLRDIATAAGVDVRTVERIRDRSL